MSDALVRPAVKALIENGGGEILLLRAVGEKSEYYILPGGKIEHGESPIETVVREVREEISCELTVGDVAGMYHFFADEGFAEGDEIVITVFEGTIDSPANVDISNNPADEGIEEYLWVTPEEAAELTDTTELSKFLADFYEFEM